jgi:hypothetical protein
MAAMDQGNRALAGGLALLGGLVVIYAVLGPLVLDAIHFRTSASGLNQIRGGDLAALTVVAPSCFAIAWLAWRGHPAAPVLALAPGLFAMYMYSQLILANEYLYRPGNVERYFPLLLGLFIVAAVMVLRSWGLTQPEALPSSTRRLQQCSGILLIAMAVFVVVGLHLRTLLDAMGDQPTGAEYLALPTTFWVVKFYDLGIVAPAALAVGIGLLRRQPWARKPAYGILGGYVLLAWSVAGMGWSMMLNADPDASVAVALGMTALAAAGTVFAYFLYRPLFRASVNQSTAAAGSTATTAATTPVAPSAIPM